jgi:hypothetical protein
LRHSTNQPFSTKVSDRWAIGGFMHFMVFTVELVFISVAPSSAGSSRLLKIGLANFQIAFDQMDAQVCRIGLKN